MANNEIVLYGTVGASFWDEPSFTTQTVRESLAAMAGPVTVRLNSGGGVATEGQAIYNMLKDYPGHVTISIDGAAASAASLIAMAGDTITFRDGAWMLIHDPATPYAEGRGTEAEHRRVADMLGVIANGYAAVYAKRTGSSVDEARRMMRDETIMDGPTALQMGFADKVEDQPAMVAADFDYRIYAHAPDVARVASERFGDAAKAKTAIMAMIAGEPRATKEEPPMAEKSEAAGAPANEIDVTAAVAAATTAERDRARRINAAVNAAGLEPTMAVSLIDEGLSLEMALDKIVAKAAEKAPTPTRPQPATIIRDERATMQIGMQAALEAQMGGTAPEHDAGRGFMSMSLVDMAAQAIGRKESVRTAYDREEVVRMAMHATSDFPGVLENALNKRLQANYIKAQPTYMAIAERADFQDFRPHPTSNVGDFPALQPIGEGGEIKRGTIGEKREVVAIQSRASAVTLSRQMVINDDLRAFERVVRNASYSATVAEEVMFWDGVFNIASGAGPTLLETGRAMFNTTDQTLAASASAITVAALSVARAALMRRRGIPSAAGKTDGQLLAYTPSILLVGPDKLTEAETIVQPIVAAQASNVNPFSGRLTVVATPYIAGNAWYLFAAPEAVSNFMYGYLNGATAPRVRTDEPFGTQGISYSLEHDFGCGAQDFRAGWRNAGA